MADPSNSPITSSTLSEAASKDLVERYGVPLAAEYIVADAESAVAAAAEIGGAVAVKLNGDTIAHKTERGLVRLSLADEAAVRSAAEELLAAARPEDG
ncbi:MAG: acetate--CoA ligase family protein, partial [Acidimicrobiaceae bacterium]